MGEVAGEITLDPRQMGEITGLAVAPVQAREDAEDLRGPLGRKQRVGGGEGPDIEGRVPAAALAGVEAEQPQLELGAGIDPGILQQRRDVVGRVAHHGVLEVDQPDPLQPVALGHQIRFGEW